MAGILKVDQVQSDSNLAFAIAGSNVAFMNATSLQMVGSNVSLAGTNVITNGKVVVSGLPIGSVVQTVFTAYTPGNISTSTTGSFVDAGIAALSITPRSSSSKILIGYFNVGGHRNTNGPGNGGSYYTIYRDIAGGGYSNLSDATYGITNNALSSGTFTDQNPVNYIWIDSPATTSTVNYKPYYKVYSSSGYFSHAGYGSVTFYAVAMEISV
jgi:hypothetical protein